MNEMRSPGETGNPPDMAADQGGVPMPSGNNYLQTIKLQDKILPVASLILGIVFVWLLYGKLPGVSVPLFIIAFYVLLLTYAKPALKKDAIFGWFLCIPIFLLSMAYVFFGNNVFRVLNLLALPVLVLLQTLLVTDANSFKWYSPGIVIDLLFGMFYRCLAHVIKPFGILSVLFRKNNGKDGSKSVAMRVLTGVVISLPLLLILLALLASADMVFGSLVEQFTKLFEIVNLEDLVGKAIVAMIICFLSFSYLWSIAHKERMSESTVKSMPPPTALQKGFLDPVMIITITVAINILYVIFVVIQFAYLFGGSGLPDGFTYAEYARKGFFELIFVTLLNIGFLAFTLTFTRKDDTAAGLPMRIMNSVMICCTFVMLFSAHFRMSLYEEAYGYTFLRVMTHSFMAFLLVLFVITLARVWKDGLSLLKPYIAVSVIAFVVVNYMNVDRIIAGKNIERYSKTNVIDIDYFRSLSSDAILEVRNLTGDKNPDVAKKAKELLKERKAQLAKNRDWQSFNLADQKARTELDR